MCRLRLSNKVVVIPIFVHGHLIQSETCVRSRRQSGCCLPANIERSIERRAKNTHDDVVHVLRGYRGEVICIRHRLQFLYVLSFKIRITAKKKINTIEIVGR